MTFEAKYDAWNRLVSLKEDGKGVAAYEYDGLGRRICKDLGGGSEVHYYYNEQWQCLEERATEEE